MAVQPGPLTQGTAQRNMQQMGQVPMKSLLKPLGLFLEVELQGEKNLTKRKQKSAPTSRRGVILFVMCWVHQPEVSSPGT